MTAPTDTTRLRIRLYLPNGSMLGPGKADLISLIAETGSIAAAGRRLGMSYKRAWGLVETMNAMFSEPLIASSRGGAKHGGATVTEAGHRVLELYRAIETKTRTQGRSEIAELERLLAPSPAEPTPAPSDMSRRK